MFLLFVKMSEILLWIVFVDQVVNFIYAFISIKNCILWQKMVNGKGIEKLLLL